MSNIRSSAAWLAWPTWRRRYRRLWGAGGFFFADIERNQVDAAGLALLRFMAAQGEGIVIDRILDEPPETRGRLARRDDYPAR